MSVERLVGIDFGTSTSVIRVKRYKDGQPVDDRFSKIDVVFGSGSQMVPTLIQKTSKGTYYGYEAEIPKEKGEKLCQNFKINLESNDSAKKAEACELTEEFFSYLGKEYRAQSEGGYLGDPTDAERTIVSYPVKWCDETKRFMVNAAKKAGFKNVEGMDEAQAAIHAVTVQYENLLTKNGIFKYNVPCNILLIDMGAGTTDLVMCCYTPGKNAKTEILCTWPLSGDVLFGGKEVDEKLIDYVRDLMPMDNPMSSGILKKVGIKEFKSWKESVVSPALQRNEIVETFSKVDDIAELMDLDMDPYNIDRTTLERYLADYLDMLPQLVNGCIEKSGLCHGDIDLVILTGGHSQWYFVDSILQNATLVDLPRIQKDLNRILKISRPQETVALGMVYKPLSIKLKEFKTKHKGVNDIVDVYILFNGQSIRIKDIILFLYKEQHTDYISIFLKPENNSFFYVTDGETSGMDLFSNTLISNYKCDETVEINFDHISVRMEFSGYSIDIKDITDYIKKKILDDPNQFVTVFLKPEEAKAYYIIDGITSVIDICLE